MNEPQSKAVLRTLVLSDVVDSTRLTQTLGDVRAASARHEAIVREEKGRTVRNPRDRNR